MTSRDFSQINVSILRSRKMRGLGHAARWAWLCAHLKADFLGLAEYAQASWGIDADIGDVEIPETIGQLVDAGLIEWFPEQEFVRVVGFIKQRPPDNASAATRMCLDLTERLYESEVELEAMLLRASAEFAMASVSRSLRWNKDRAKFREEMGEFLRGTANDFGDRFLDALMKELEGAGRPTRNELDALLPTLSLHRQNTVSTPSQHRADTQDVDETRRRTDENKDRDEDLDGSTELSEAAPAEGQKERTRKMQRMGEIVESGAIHGPTESTKRSALVVGTGT